MQEKMSHKMKANVSNAATTRVEEILDKDVEVPALLKSHSSSSNSLPNHTNLPCSAVDGIQR